MPQPVDLGELNLNMYDEILPSEMEELRQQAEDLRGLRILHINATPYGGGVSELLRSLVPLERALGLDSNWQVITADKSFFRVTKAIHNALQGAPYKLTKSDRETYLAYNSLNARDITDDYDVIIVHDPQPAAICSLRSDIKAKWIWRCHIDTSAPNSEAWEFLYPYVSKHDAKVFTMPDFIPKGLDGKIEIIAPAIDPLSPKNTTLPEHMARQLINWIGVPKDGPLICQVSRFDPWKDPLGVIEAYHLIKQELPNVHLALIGSMALDDPEGWEIYQTVVDVAKKDRNLHVFTNLIGVGDLQVNAFQRLADVVIQKSIREGFGLVISETLWKGTPVVAGRAGGIPSQMAGGGGFLVNSVEETAEKTLILINDRKFADLEGSRGREYVRKNFLVTRLVRDHLQLMASLLRVAV